MKLEQSFDVAAPIDEVWAALIDVEHVASKLPGAEITGRNHDGGYDGTFTIKIGPTTASYRGRLEMESVDEATRTATMHAQGADRRGQGGASASIVSRLADTGQGTTRVDVDTDYHITGRLARFGRGGMIEDISERLLREFASRLQASLEGNGGEPTESAAADQAPTAEFESASSTPAESVARAEAPRPAPSEARAPLDGLALARSVVANRVRGNPWPLLALVGVCLVLLLRLMRRRR